MKNLIFRIFPLLSLLTLPLLVRAQETSYSDPGSFRVDSLEWRGKLDMAFSGGRHTPFWLISNRHGMGSVEKNNGYVRASIFKDMDRSNRFSWGAGVDLAAGVRQQSPFFIQQLYGEIRYKCLDLMIGQKEIDGVISNPHLSSGNLLYSGNAHPIPQVRAGIFDYASVWGTKGWFSVKGYLAYGMFTDSRWLRNWIQPDHYLNKPFPQNVLYHSKGIWLRGGNTDKFPLTFEIGIDMATQFGGNADYYIQPGEIRHEKFPSGIKAWLKALIPMSGGNTASEQTNIQGNFLGNWTFAFTWKPQSDWSLKAYYQHMFEDHSMMVTQYTWRDGLWGLEAKLPKNPFVSNIVAEFLYFKDQTGPVYWDKTDVIPTQVSGRDNYYSHFMYGAWQNWGMIIGTPLAISPIYNNGSLSLLSTRFVGGHLGFEGEPCSEIGYRVMATFSRHWGTYNYPLPEVKNSFNFLAEVAWHPRKLAGWEGRFSLGADGGSLLGRSIGLGISISKTGLIKF